MLEKITNIKKIHLSEKAILLLINHICTISIPDP